MAEKGGRACKEGARYEDKCIINQLLDVLYGINYSVTIEPTGEDEIVTDMIVVKADGMKEYIQCKSSNGSKAIWSVSDLISNNLLKGWREHLIKDDNDTCVALMSPCKTELDELIFRANNSGEDAAVFYNSQIGSNKIKEIYLKYCEGTGIKPLIAGKLNIEEIKRSIAYLKRIHMLPWNVNELDSSIERAIQTLFAKNAEHVFGALLSWVVDGDILGEEITSIKITRYLEKKDIHLKLQEEGKDILCLSEINRAYSCRYRYINEKTIIRKEFEDCIKLLDDDKSFVISGCAGVGKSGCTEAIITHCVEQNVPYIAVKLDVSFPRDNACEWGESLGFSASIPIVMHKMSLNSKAVIIFDQLDALRWTQANSYRAIEVCMEVINQVRRLNLERKKKLLVVFVCRSYDLVNDNNIKMLFDQKGYEEEWSRIEVGELEEKHVKQVVGDNYAKMSSKLKKLLRIPSNLFIWEKIKDKEGGSKKCEASGQLLQYWYQELCSRCRSHSIEEGRLKKQIDLFVTLLDEKGRLFFPKLSCGIDSDVIEYLVSEGFLALNGNMIGFVHQSILDYLISVKMFNGFYADASIEEIIGPKAVQTPTKRYQVLMLLQNIMETDTNDFIKICKLILESQEVRYYMKALVFETIAQNSNVDSVLLDYVIDNIKKGKDFEHWILDVVNGNNVYICRLIETGILAQWFDEPSRKDLVFKLLSSVRHELTNEEIQFMAERSFVSEEDDCRFASVISMIWPTDNSDVVNYTLKLFEYRPQLIKNIHFQISKILPCHESATAKLLGLWYTNNDEYNLGESDYTEDLSNIEIQDGKTILDTLLQYVPKEKMPRFGLYEWRGDYNYKKSVERQIVEIICAANRAIIRNNSMDFWHYYKKNIGKGFSVYNEIIIRALCYMPENCSDDVIKYIGRNLDNIFDNTSGADDMLYYAKQSISAHVMACSDEVYSDFENCILKFVPKNATKKYMERIEFNRKKEWGWADWPYWGRLQHELFAVIPDEKLSLQARQLLKVLDRRFESDSSKYINSKMHGGMVKSVVADKKISERQWLQIITNKKIPERKPGKIVEEGMYVHSDIDAFAESFRLEVANNPNKMIKLVLSHLDIVRPQYIDAILAGSLFSNTFEEVELSDWETLLKCYTCPMEIVRAIYFLEIIEKGSDKNWSDDILNRINDIVKQDDSNDSVKVEEKRRELDGRTLWDYSVNSMRGHAAITISRVISQREELFEKFKVSIRLLADSSSAIDRMAALFPLRACYSIDKEWASKYILSIFERDIRTIAFRDRIEMLVPLYCIYPKRITKILKKGFESDDKSVVDVAASSMCCIYMMNGDFSSIILNKNGMNEEQIKNIVYMAVSYLEVTEKREKAKELILELADSSYDLEFPLSRIFYEKKVGNDDREFLVEILSKKNGRRLLHAFITFIEDSAVSIKDFADIIINLSNSILKKSDDEINSQWGMVDEFSKIIIALYDECAGMENEVDKKYAEGCMDIWDVIFERQLGVTRNLSRQLMDR